MTVNISSSSSNPALMLEARALACVRGERRLFEVLNLTVSSGECLHVRGENASGKQFIRLLTGLSKPESGEVLWGQQSITHDSSSYHRELLFLGHRDALKEDLTALENLQLYSALDIHLPMKSFISGVLVCAGANTCQSGLSAGQSDASDGS
jgi:heme exporter protein A